MKKSQAEKKCSRSKVISWSFSSSGSIFRECTSNHKLAAATIKFIIRLEVPKNKLRVFLFS